MNKNLFFCAVLLGSLSCDNTFIYQLPTNPPKLTLNCIQKNGERWVVGLTLSKGVLETGGFSRVSNALVNIFEDGQLMESLTPIKDGVYIANTSYPVPGKTYKIEATAEPYSTATGMYKQPQAVDVEKLEVKTLGEKSFQGYPYNNAQCKVTFTDPVGDNFYELIIVQASDSTAFPSFSGQLSLVFTDPAYQENNGIYMQTVAFTDSHFEGNRVTLDFKCNNSFQDPNRPLDYYQVYLRNLSREHYLYLKTYSIQQKSKVDPFAPPVHVENNIQNGFGVFAGFTVTRKVFKITN